MTKIEKLYNAIVRAMMIADAIVSTRAVRKRIEGTLTLRGKGAEDVGACVNRRSERPSTSKSV